MNNPETVLSTKPIQIFRRYKKRTSVDSKEKKVIIFREIIEILQQKAQVKVVLTHDKYNYFLFSSQAIYIVLSNLHDYVGVEFDKSYKTVQNWCANKQETIPYGILAIILLAIKCNRIPYSTYQRIKYLSDEMLKK